jgi:ArsR family transcriptional regulator
MAELLVSRKSKDKERRKGKMLKLKNEDPVTAKIATLPDNIAKDLVQMFKLFADETRLRILHFLMQQEELNVREMCNLLGQSQPAVSHHLALLRVAGLIECRRDGKHNFYSILHKRFRELMEMVFSVTPDQGGRIGFESFVLSYTPVDALK